MRCPTGKIIRYSQLSLIFLFLLSTGGADAGEVVSVSKGFDFRIPLIEVRIKWLQTDRIDYFPSMKQYESKVKELLNSEPMCLDTKVYCRVTEMNELGIDGSFVFKKTMILPSTVQRPHEDPRVVEHWERQDEIRGGLEIVNGLITRGSLGGTLESLTASRGGRY